MRDWINLKQADKPTAIKSFFKIKYIFYGLIAFFFPLLLTFIFSSRGSGRIEMAPNGQWQIKAFHYKYGSYFKNLYFKEEFRVELYQPPTSKNRILLIRQPVPKQGLENFFKPAQVNWAKDSQSALIEWENPELKQNYSLKISLNMMDQLHEN